MIDIGAESTRPGAEPVSLDQEWARLEPLLTTLTVDAGVALISIDTSKAEVARRSAALGVRVFNDINGLQGDPEMVHVVAETGAGVIVMHNGRIAPVGCDIVASVCRFFAKSLVLLEKAGVPATRVILDPGFGFGKDASQNIELLRRLGELRCFGLPLMVAASRKSFIGAVTGDPVGDRLEGTIVASAAGVASGADLFRIHDVAPNCRALRVADALWRKNGQEFAQ